VLGLHLSARFEGFISDASARLILFVSTLHTHTCPVGYCTILQNIFGICGLFSIKISHNDNMCKNTRWPLCRVIH